MSWIKGWNFRGNNTSTGFINIDTGNNTYALGNTDEVYPVTTRNSVTFGWGLAVGGLIDSRNRNAANPQQFAGLNFTTTGAATNTFRVDLPATGDYIIRAAFGENDNALSVFGGSYARFFDDTTLLATLDVTNTTANQYVDASAVNRTSPADWLANNVGITKTFTTTIFKLTLGNGSSRFGLIAHLLLEQVVASTAWPIPVFTQHYDSQRR